MESLAKLGKLDVGLRGLNPWGPNDSNGVPVVPLSPPNFVISCEQLSVIAAINGGELVLVLCWFFHVFSCVCLKMRCAPNSEGSHHQIPNWK